MWALLALLTFHQSGSAESKSGYGGYGYGRRGYRRLQDEEEEEDAGDYEMGEVPPFLLSAFAIGTLVGLAVRHRA